MTNDIRLKGPVMAITVGSGRHIAKYNLPVALLCYHSHLFRQESLRYEAVRARLGSNKKRKVTTDDKTLNTEVKIEGSEGGTETESIKDIVFEKDEAMVRLPNVDPTIFGLFLKYVYTGYYPAVVDAQAGSIRSTSHNAMPTQQDVPYTPAKVAMPPPANINFRQVPPGGHMPPLPVPDSSTFALTLQDSGEHPPIPSSVHAYLLAIHLGAPGFLNQALNHIYYGIGKYFTLTPRLVHYIWSHTSPHPFCSSSPLRKLILDVLVVHWSSTTIHIIAKHPTLNSLWNEVFDTHRDLRHRFTMGLQADTKVSPVLSYFVDTHTPSATKNMGVQEPKAEVVERTSMEVNTSAAAAAAVTAAMEQGNGGGEEKG
jgi:hypothetical protein